MKGPARRTAARRPRSFRNFTTLALRVGEGLRGVAAFEGRIVEVAYDLHGGFVADRPKSHQQIPGARLNEATAQTHHAFAGFRFAGAGVAGGERHELGSVQS